jgi:hypothetical protein
MKAIWAETAEWLFWLGRPAVTPTIPTMNSQITIPKAPQMRIVRRPYLSMIQKEIGVEQTLTRVVTSWIKKGFEMVPNSWKKVVPK